MAQNFERSQSRTIAQTSPRKNRGWLPDNFWIWSAQSGWDLTHPGTAECDPIEPRIYLSCEISNINLDPAKTVLLIIDIQNIALHDAYSPAPAMQVAEQSLLEYAIPAARKLGIQIAWLNWGLTEDDLKSVTPAEIRTFGFRANTGMPDYGLSQRQGNKTAPKNFLSCGEHPQLRSSPGADLRRARLEDGKEVEAGRKLMRGTWNVRPHEPLAAAYEAGQAIASIPQLRRADLYMNIQSSCRQQYSYRWTSEQGELERENGSDYWD